DTRCSYPFSVAARRRTWREQAPRATPAPVECGRGRRLVQARQRPSDRGLLGAIEEWIRLAAPLHEQWGCVNDRDAIAIRDLDQQEGRELDRRVLARPARAAGGRRRRRL